jgi:adenylate cyclase
MLVPTTGLSLTDAARRVGVAPATLRRWLREGLIPQHNGNGWTTGAVGQARVVARMRDRGHSLQSIRKASEEGRLAYAYADELFPGTDHQYTLEEAARESGLEPALIERIVTAIGFPARADSVTEEDLQLLRYASAALDAGFPLVAMLQVVRVYGQAIAQVADAEVRLFHLYVHEPLMRSGSSELEVAEQMEDLSKVLLPLASPVIDQIHQRYLQHFIEQDIVGHMESDLDGAAVDLGRIRVAIAFADLTGYTRLTEEEGELEALDALERFVEAVEATLPDSARVVKLIGDEVMIVGSDPSSLIDWAVGFQRLQSERPLPRIGIHFGEALYRDGDYYGRDVNIASRITARSAGGEVLVTRPVVEHAGPHLELDRIGEIKLKGFTEPTEMFLARGRHGDD